MTCPRSLRPLLSLLLIIASSKATDSVLLWSDEFQQTSPDLKSDVWNFRTGQTGWGNFELQNYTESNAVVTNEALHINIHKEVNGDGVTLFTSARIDTADKVEVQYGTIAARIWLPDVVEGLWPAFWTLGNTFANGMPWPDCGEMSIMETGQGRALAQGLGNRRVVSGAHWEREGAYVTYAGDHDFQVDLNGSYSVFKLDWTPYNITTYVNDTEVWKMDIDSTSCTDCEEFHRPHFLVFNVGVGGGFTSGSTSSSSAAESSSAGCDFSSAFGVGSSSSGGCGQLRAPDDILAPLPAAMIVDWVRIYDNGHTTLTLFPPPPQATPYYAPTAPERTDVILPTPVYVPSPTTPSPVPPPEYVPAPTTPSFIPPSPVYVPPTPASAFPLGNTQVGSDCSSGKGNGKSGSSSSSCGKSGKSGMSGKAGMGKGMMRSSSYAAVESDFAVSGSTQKRQGWATVAALAVAGIAL